MQKQRQHPLYDPARVESRRRIAGVPPALSAKREVLYSVGSLVISARKTTAIQSAGETTAIQGAGETTAIQGAGEMPAIQGAGEMPAIRSAGETPAIL